MQIAIIVAFCVAMSCVPVNCSVWSPPRTMNAEQTVASIHALPSCCKGVCHCHSMAMMACCRASNTPCACSIREAPPSTVLTSSEKFDKSTLLRGNIENLVFGDATALHHAASSPAVLVATTDPPYLPPRRFF